MEPTLEEKELAKSIAQKVDAVMQENTPGLRNELAILLSQLCLGVIQNPETMQNDPAEGWSRSALFLTETDRRAVKQFAKKHLPGVCGNVALSASNILRLALAAPEVMAAQAGKHKRYLEQEGFAEMTEQERFRYLQTLIAKTVEE